MTREEKNLLLKDLCQRQMYNVKCQVFNDVNPHTLSGILHNKPHSQLYFEELDWKEYDGFVNVEYCKPYLLPLSSITEEQMEELEELCSMYTPDDDYHPYAHMGIKVLYKHVLDDDYKISSDFNTDVIDWLNAHHFDYRGLIEKGLAIDATGKNIY